MIENSNDHGRVMLWAAKDGSRAVIENLPPKNYLGYPISMDDIKLELELLNISEGIKWEIIENAIQQAIKTQKPVQNVLVAEAMLNDYVLQCAGTDRQFGKKDLLDLKEQFKCAFQFLSNPVRDLKIPPVLFAKKEEPFLRVSNFKHGKNIFGKTVNLQVPKQLFLINDSIVVIERDHETEYLANQSGFVVMNDQNKLDIWNPLQVSPDKMQMFYLLLPVIHGKEEMISDFIDILLKEKQTEDVSQMPKKEELANQLATDRLVKRIIRQGKTPIHGKDAEIIIKVKQTARPEKNKQGTVNYRELSPFQEIEQGTIIAEKVPPRKGIPGVDVFGNSIPVEPVQDVHFKTGHNVIEEEKEEKVVYTAETTGILHLDGNSAFIQEELHIRGDICTQTGNIHYSRDIIIDGNINSGFLVECGHDLLVKGNIDNGAVVVCKGNLKVLNGVFGRNTKITVLANAEIGFMQESSIRVKDNLTVKDYLYNSHVFCGGSLYVQGKSIKRDTKGCIIGGRANSMGSMYLHSAGSEATVTELFCGIDAEAYDNLQELRKLLPVLTRKVTGMQNSLGVDITDPNAMEKVKSMPLLQKMKIKERLIQLKEVTKQREEVNSKISLLEEKTVSKNLPHLFVEIANHIVPHVIIRIGERVKRIEQNENRLKFFLKDDHIFYESMKTKA